MKSNLDKILKSYEVYYDINTQDVEEPFDAEAIFHSHNEQYFLMRRAQISEMDVHEYVFFIEVNSLTLKKLKELVETAWQRGLSRVKPSSHHRNSDVVLVILAQTVSPDCLEYIKKNKLTKNYKFSFHGWSSFQLIVKDLTTGELYLNKYARNHKKLYNKIFKGGL